MRPRTCTGARNLAAVRSRRHRAHRLPPSWCRHRGAVGGAGAADRQYPRSAGATCACTHASHIWELRTVSILDLHAPRVHPLCVRLPVCAHSPTRAQSSLFAALCGAIIAILRIIQELWQAEGGVFNVDDVVVEMCAGTDGPPPHEPARRICCDSDTPRSHPMQGLWAERGTRHAHQRSDRPVARNQHALLGILEAARRLRGVIRTDQPWLR